MDKEKLRLLRLSSAATLVTAFPEAFQPPPGLSAEAAGAIYGKIARYGFSGFQMLPIGGAQYVSADQVTVVTLAGTGWEYLEDLSSSAFELAVEKQAVVLAEFFKHLRESESMFLSHAVDLHAVWPLDRGHADAFVETHFLTPTFQSVAGAFGGLSLNGGGLRWALTRPLSDPVPPGLDVQPLPLETFDLRLEPFFADKSQLFLQATAIYPAPTTQLRRVTERAYEVRGLLYDTFADSLFELDRRERKA
jgi:hypothetical protein